MVSDVVTDVSALKAEPDREILVVGSGEIGRLPKAAELVDEIRLLVHPIIVGGGKKLSADAPIGESGFPTSTGLALIAQSLAVLHASGSPGS